MGLYDKISKMSDKPGTYEEKLYRILIDDKYSTGSYCRRDLGEGMEVIDQEHIDWESMKNLPEEAWTQLRAYSFSYPSFIRGYHNGIAEVEWQLIPDGRYWMDDDGFGMTTDVELNIYGFIDQSANIISKFHYYTDEELQGRILDKVRKQAEVIVNNKITD